MSEDPDEPQIAPLVLGLTRPRMMAGIAFELFVFEFVLVVLIFVNTKNLLVFLLLIPIHAIAFVMTVRDAHIVDIIKVKLGKCPATRNRSFWGGNSYAP